MAGFDTKDMMNRAIRYMAQTAMDRAAGGWVPPKERERQQREAMRQEQQQARQAEKQQKEAARAHEKEQKLLSKQFPTQYMPNVGRQVMMAGGVPDPNAPKPLSQIINRNQDIMPSIGDPTPEELSTARADTRVGRDIVANRLNTIVPESERVVGGKYRPGAPGGGRWSDLPPEVLNSPGRGFNVTDEELQNLWRQSLEESSEAAKKAANDNQVAPKFLAKDWDKAMRLPLSDHLWYELSGEKMAENMPDLTHSEFLKLMDLIGATSARAKPGENLERSLAALSQYLRNAPIDVDLTIPETVRQALGRSQEGSSALPGNKTGYFSDTLALTGGVPTRMPISVNDVWVGKMFGVPDNVMSSNQSLHEPMAKYFNKIRDLYNERHGHEVPFPYQSWNFQAPAWVHLRGEEAGMESGDAYHQVWDSIINKLKDKNIPGVTGNSISREALMHPDFADALRRTTAPFRSAPKATVEFGTKLTNVGQTAHDHYQRAISANDELSQNEYLSGLTKAMYASARGEGHPWERLKKAITGTLGQGGDITRIANPTSESPLDIGGTFEGDVSPNIRVPLKDMSDDQIAYFNAVAGKHLKQKAMAASYVLDPEGPDSPPREGHIRGYSAFVPTTEGMDPADIRAFAKELSKIGHDTSYARYPNGYRFDIIPNFNLDTPKGIDHTELADAYDATLVNKYGAPAILAHDFKSVYTPDTEYDGLKSKLIQEIKSDFIKQAQEAGIPISAARKILADPSLSGGLKGRSAKAWDTYSKRIDHLSSAEQGFKDLAQRVSDAHSTFITKAEKRQKKYRDGFREGGSVYEPHQRAEEQGYSIRGYHVTKGPRASAISSAKRFDPYMSMAPGEEATFFWDNPNSANEWASHMIGEQSFDPQTMSERGIDRAERHATSVMPVRIHPGKSATIDWMEATGQPHYNNRKMAQIIRNARDLGFDTIRIKNMIEGEMPNAPRTPEEMASYKPADQIAVLNPHVIRSEFAEFDPQKFGRDDLGAARGGEIGGYADGGSPSLGQRILDYAETLPTAEENIETIKKFGRNVGEGAADIGKRVFSGFEKIAERALDRSPPPTVRAGERPVYVEPKREAPPQRLYVLPDGRRVSGAELEMHNEMMRERFEEQYAMPRVVQENMPPQNRPVPTRAPMREKLLRQEQQANVNRPVVLPERKGFDFPQVYKDIMSDEPQMEWTKGMTPREQAAPVETAEGSIFASRGNDGSEANASGPLEVSVTKTITGPKDVYLGTGDTPNPFHSHQTMVAPAPEYEGQVVPIPDTPADRMGEHHLSKLILPIRELQKNPEYRAKQGLEDYNPPMSATGERFPNQEDVNFYRDVDATYGSPEAGYLQQGARGSYYDDLSKMADRQGGYRRTMTPQESDAFNAAYIAAQRNPIAALGFRPEEFDFSGNPIPQTTAGSVLGTSSRIYADLKFPSVAVHEAIHRGLMEIENEDYNAYRAKTDSLLKEMNDLTKQRYSPETQNRIFQISDELDRLYENKTDPDIFPPGQVGDPEEKVDEQELFVRSLMYKMFGPVEAYEMERQLVNGDVIKEYPQEKLERFMSDNADRIARLEQRAMKMLQERQRAAGPRASGGAVRGKYALGGNPADRLGGGYGTGNIGGGSSISSGGSMAEARAADRASVSGYSADSGGGSSWSGGGGGGGGRDSSPSRDRGTSGGDGGRDFSIGGPQGLTGAPAFGRPEQGTDTYNLDNRPPMTVGARFSPNIGADLVKEAVTPDFSTGNSPLASGVSSYDQNAINALYDRMRAEQQAERNESYERSVVGPTTPQINVPNAGDLYGATDAPLAVNQKPSGMFGQPEFGTTRFGQNPMQSGFPKQSDIETRASGPFSQPNRPITPTPFSGYPQEVQNALNPVKPDSAFGQTLIDPTGKYTNQALDQMGVATDALTMLNSPTLAGAFVRAFTPTPTPATAQQQAAIERMYRRDLNTGVPANFATPEGMAERYGAPGATPLARPGQTPTAYLSAGPSASTGRQDMPIGATSANQTPKENFSDAFAAARARGDQTFSWTNPATGQTMLYTTQLARKQGGRVPSLKEPEQWECEEKR